MWYKNKFVENSINIVNLTKKKILAYTLWKTQLNSYYDN